MPPDPEELDTLPERSDSLVSEAWDGQQRTERFEELWRALAAAPREEPIGAELERIGDFELIDELGRGGMGVVYLARDMLLDRLVALKLLRDDVPGDILGEARAAARLRHPNIVDVYAVVRSPRGLLLAMEYVEGGTLSARLREGSLARGEKLSITAQLLDAMAAAHEAEVMHGDLKPSNVLFGLDGTVAIVDWGLARRIRAGDDEGIVPGGTPGYMPPEQERGEELDARADVFALGVLLAQVWTGAYVKAGDPELGAPDAVAALLQEVGAPLALAHPILAALTPSRNARPPSAGHLRDLFDDALLAAGLEPLARSPSRPVSGTTGAYPAQSDPSRPSSSGAALRGARRRWMVALLALAIGAALLFLVMGDDAPERRASAAATAPSGPPTPPSPRSPARFDAVRTPVALLAGAPTRDRRLREAVGAFQSMRYGEADAILSALVAADPRDVDAHYYRSLNRAFGISHRIGEPYASPPEAVAPTHPARRGVLAAAEAFEKKTLPEVIPRLRELTESHPHDWELWYALGEALYHADRPRASLGAFQRSRELAPEFLPGSSHLHTLALIHTPASVPRLVEDMRALDVDPGDLPLELRLRRGERLPREPPTTRHRARLVAMDALLHGEHERAEELASTVLPGVGGPNEVDAAFLAGVHWYRGDEEAYARFADLAAERRLNQPLALHLLLALEDAYASAMVGDRARAEAALEEAAKLRQTEVWGWRGCLALLLLREAGTPPLSAHCREFETLRLLDDASRAEAAEANDLVRRALARLADGATVYPIAWWLTTLGLDEARERACALVRRPPFARPTWPYALAHCESDGG